MIRVTQRISIDENELKWKFIHACGPGGQNVNKVATAVQLFFHVNASDSLPDDVRQRLRRLAGNRIHSEGVLVIDARRSRSQSANRKDALDRLVHLIRQAARVPKKRRKTKPTAASKRRRLRNKKRRSDIKRLRKPVDRDE